MFGIYKIFETTKELQKYNTKVTINKRTMILHSVLLALQSFVAVFNALDYYIPFLYKRNALINIILTLVDLIVQLTICYICLTMGS
jgi:hypothetical protein